MSKNLLILGGIIILVIIGFVVFRSEPGPAAPPSSGVKAPVILSEQNNSGQSGSALFTEEGGNAKVMVNLENSPAGPQPAHIHVGSCATLGDVRYPLTSPENGSSETTLNVSLAQLSSELPLAVNVHKSPAEAQVYVACGDISADSLLSLDDSDTTQY